LAKQTEDSRGHWALTEDGFRALRVSESLRCVGQVLRPRPIADAEELCVFELLHRLAEDGWRFQVFLKQKRADRPNAAKNGEEKICWARPDQKQWSALYLRALLRLGGSSGEAAPVEHFQVEHYYTCLLAGVGYVKGRWPKAKDTSFAFMAQDGVAAAPLPSLEAPSASSAEEASAASTSSASSSSSSSSASSSSSRAGNIAGKDVAGDQEVEPKLDASRTQHWKGYKFTPTYHKDGSLSGWEARCYLEMHKGDGVMCRRRRLFSTNGGAEAVERALKHWCITADKYASRALHRDAPDLGLEELPTLQEPEACEVSNLDEPCRKKRKGAAER